MRLASVTVTRRSETISRVTYSLKYTEAHKTAAAKASIAILFWSFTHPTALPSRYAGCGRNVPTPIEVRVRTGHPLLAAGIDLTKRFEYVAKALASLPGDTVIDGELAALREEANRISICFRISGRLNHTSSSMRSTF
jgi:hypothetical protein